MKFNVEHIRIFEIELETVVIELVPLKLCMCIHIHKLI